MFAALRQLVEAVTLNEEKKERNEYSLHDNTISTTSISNDQNKNHQTKEPTLPIKSTLNSTSSNHLTSPHLDQHSTQSTAISSVSPTNINIKATKLTSTSSHSPLPDDSDGIPWSRQLKVRECFVYHLDPSHHDLSALFAESFRLDKPIVTGELTIYTKNDWLYVRLCDAQGEIFADSVWLDCAMVDRPTPLSHFIQPVKDSSRYFALRVGEPGPKPKRVAHLLIGFRERPSAFDLLATISDCISLAQRLEMTKETDAQSEQEAEQRLEQSHVDMSLKGSIHVKLHLRQPTSADQSSASGDVDSDNQHKRTSSIAVIQSDHGMILAPPPPAHVDHTNNSPDVENKQQHKKKKKTRKVKVDSEPAIVQPIDESANSSVVSQPTLDEAEGIDEWNDFAGA